MIVIMFIIFTLLVIIAASTGSFKGVECNSMTSLQHRASVSMETAENKLIA